MSRCKHCGKNIIQSYSDYGTGWTHQPEGAAFMDNVNPYCVTTAAEPAEEPT